MSVAGPPDLYVKSCVSAFRESKGSWKSHTWAPAVTGTLLRASDHSFPVPVFTQDELPKPSEEVRRTYDAAFPLTAGGESKGKGVSFSLSVCREQAHR